MARTFVGRVCLSDSETEEDENVNVRPRRSRRCRFQRKTILAGVVGIGIAFLFMYSHGVEWTLKNDSVTEDRPTENNVLSGVEWTLKKDSVTEDRPTENNILRRVLWSMFLGVSFGGFTWGIIYIDSAVPGVFPPTPLSSKRDRRRSGHTFHSGYIVAILSGSFACLYSLIRTFYCDCNSDKC